MNLLWHGLPATPVVARSPDRATRPDRRSPAGRRDHDADSQVAVFRATKLTSKTRVFTAFQRSFYQPTQRERGANPALLEITLIGGQYVPL